MDRATKGNTSHLETWRRDTSSALWSRSGDIQKGFHEDMMIEQKLKCQPIELNQEKKKNKR